MQYVDALGTLGSEDGMHATGMVILALISGALAQSDSAAGATPEQIARAIDQLGAPRFEARQAATDELWRAGATAQSALQQAVKSSDPEVRTRAIDLLNKLRLGIRPDTPPELLALIDQFRFSPNPSQRREALRQLQAQGSWATIMALIRGEQDPQERRNLATAMAGESSKLLAPLLARGDLDQIEELLQLVASSDVGLPQLTTFLLVTDRLDRRIEQARQRAEEEPLDTNWTRLAYLLRAKGDRSAAIAAADKTNDLILRSNLNAEAGRWLAAATLAEQIFQQNTNRLEAAAFATTFFRLAGREIDHQRTLDTLLKSAGVDRLKDNAQLARPADPFAPAANYALTNLTTAAKTLLVNERVEEALQVLRKINPPLAHLIYSRQHRHREALALAGVTPDKALDRAWLEQLPQPPQQLLDRIDYRFAMAAQVARELRELGRKEQSEQVWKLLESLSVPVNDRAKRSAQLAMLAWQLGRHDDATLHAANSIAAGALPGPVLNLLVGPEGPPALAWYEQAMAGIPTPPRQQAIARAIWLVLPDRRGGKPPENWREVVAAARASLNELTAAQKAAQLAAFGQTCQIRGDEKLARELFTEAAGIDPANSRYLGDLAAADGKWNEAARYYAAACKAEPDNHLAGLLLGIALKKSGDTEDGAKQMAGVHLAVLEPKAQHDLTLLLREPTLKQEAVQQFEIIRRTALPDSDHATQAAQEIGNIVSDDEPRRAVLSMQQRLLHLLNPSAMSDPDWYLLSHAIHSSLARAALADGQREIVATEIAQCEKLLPGDINFVLTLVPRLREKNVNDLADQLLDRVLAVHRRTIEEFPTSATYLNNAAWMAARCQRKLDEALAWSEKAITLAPDEPSYHDTLAEVHFQRGDRDAAVAAAQKAVGLAPQNGFYTTRLKHFQDDGPKSLDRSDAE